LLIAIFIFYLLLLTAVTAFFLFLEKQSLFPLSEGALQGFIHSLRRIAFARKNCEQKEGLLPFVFIFETKVKRSECDSLSLRRIAFAFCFDFKTKVKRAKTASKM
jgi:hypothetical protein